MKHDSFAMNGFIPSGLLICLAVITVFSVSPDLMGREKLTIAYIAGKKNAFYQSVEKGIRKKAKEYNIGVIIPRYPESWDPEEQVNIIQSVFTVGRPQILIISPASSEGLKETLLDLHNQGIEIITVDRSLDNVNLIKHPHRRFPLLHIATDQRKGGKILAIRMAELIDGKGKVYINSTFPDIPAISQRFKAFLKSMDEFPNISIIGIDIAGIDFSNSDKGIVGSSRELELNAHKQSLEILQKHPDINAIFCTNDLSGKGIIRTMVATGLEGSIKIGVWDATREMTSAIDAGIIDLALAQKPEEIGVAAVFWGKRYLESGETIPAQITVDFELLTKSNTSDASFRKLVYQ